MKKQIDFPTTDTRLDDKIRQTMQREFEVPGTVKEAKNRAFDRIRSNQFKQDYANDIAKKQKNSRRRKSTFLKGAAGLTAAAATFSVICISNPALAAQIPLIGHVFETIGDSLGYSGDYSKYAQPLEDDTLVQANLESETESADTENAAETDKAEGQTDEGAAAKAEDAETGAADGAYSKTVNGTTITLSEVYCNEEALNIALTIQTEDAFPETLDNNGTISVSFEKAVMDCSYNTTGSEEWENMVNAVLEGKMVDEHTFAGALRIPLDETNTDRQAYDKYWEAFQAFCDEMGVARDEDGLLDLDSYKEVLGIDTMWNNDIVSVGGPDINDYNVEIPIPEAFTVDLHLTKPYGFLPEDQTNVPEISQELRDEYETKMAEYGLDEDNYENFTDEEKEIEHQLFTDMMNKHHEEYPELNDPVNEYVNWWLDGEWDFTIDVTKSEDDVVTREINDADEDGYGIASVTKTPFEIKVVPLISDADRVEVVLDADGNLLGCSSFGGIAINGADVSKLDIYICDYIEYMDELKGYWWSEDYEEKSKTQTFKELLDERALHHTEVVF